jgi:hypothetical protein
MSHQCSDFKEIKKVATKRKQQSYAAAVKGYSKRSLVKKPSPEKLPANSVDLKKLITTVVAVLIESLKCTSIEHLSMENVVDVVYQKLHNGCTLENENESVQEERKCDVDMKDDLSERQVPEASVSAVMNDLIQENPDAIIVEKRKPERAVVSQTQPAKRMVSTRSKDKKQVLNCKSCNSVFDSSSALSLHMSNGCSQRTHE